MNRIIFSLCFLICFSCCKQKSNKDKFNISILGEWILVESYGGLCNVCPKVIFKESEKGEIIKPSGEVIHFFYKLKTKEKIVFSFIDNENYFEGKDFIYKLYEKGNLEKMSLKSIPKENEFFFSRVKSE